jgi:hypothetical protein
VGQPPGAPAEGYEWVWNGDAWVEQPIPGRRPDVGIRPPVTDTGKGQAQTRACSDVKGAAPAGFQWQGTYVVNADGSVSDTCSLVAIPADTSEQDGKRKFAREEFEDILTGMGFTTDFGFTQQEINDLFKSVDSWIGDGYSDGMDGGEKLLMKFRTSKETKDIYAKRFGGMAELASRGQAMSEGEYIRLEGEFRNVMSNYGLPPVYYDKFDDYARLIGAGLSVKEVEERVVAAKQTLNPLVAAELRQYYNLGEGDLMAYQLGLIDATGVRLAAARNQEEIRTGSRAAQIGAAAERAGFAMDKTYAEMLGGTSVGQTVDPFRMETLSRLEGEFAQARRVAERETTLAGIDREAFDQRDALAAAFGDEQARLASEKRARRERARFAGSAGTAAGSLGVERNL